MQFSYEDQVAMTTAAANGWGSYGDLDEFGARGVRETRGGPRGGIIPKRRHRGDTLMNPLRTRLNMFSNTRLQRGSGPSLAVRTWQQFLGTQSRRSHLWSEECSDLPQKRPPRGFQAAYSHLQANGRVTRASWNSAESLTPRAGWAAPDQENWEEHQAIHPGMLHTHPDAEHPTPRQPPPLLFQDPEPGSSGYTIPAGYVGPELGLRPPVVTPAGIEGGIQKPSVLLIARWTWPDHPSHCRARPYIEALTMVNQHQAHLFDFSAASRGRLRSVRNRSRRARRSGRRLTRGAAGGRPPPGPSIKWWRHPESPQSRPPRARSGHEARAASAIHEHPTRCWADTQTVQWAPRAISPTLTSFRSGPKGSGGGGPRTRLYAAGDRQGRP